MNNNNRFKGIWPVLVTPFNEDLSIDIIAYREIIEWHLQFGVGGIYANCLSSEMFMLEETERLLLIEETVKTVKGRVPVAVTANFGFNIQEHSRFCKKAADLGADIIMLTVPSFLNDDKALEDYYLKMAELNDMPLGLYECPFPRFYHLGLDLVEKLANSGRYYAYKETSCDINKILKIIDLTKNTNLDLLQANVPFLLDSIRAGAPGSMNVVANWLPDLAIEVFNRGLNNDESADNLNSTLCAMEFAQRSIHPTGVKYLMSKRGLPIKSYTRYSKKQTLEERKGIDLISQKWFNKDGSLKVLERYKYPV